MYSKDRVKRELLVKEGCILLDPKPRRYSGRKIQDIYRLYVTISNGCFTYPESFKMTCCGGLLLSKSVEDSVFHLSTAEAQYHFLCTIYRPCRGQDLTGKGRIKTQLITRAGMESFMFEETFATVDQALRNQDRHIMNILRVMRYI